MKPLEIIILVAAIGIFLAVVTGCVVRKIKGKKSGCTGCASCPYCSSCHSANKKNVKGEIKEAVKKAA